MAFTQFNQTVTGTRCPDETPSYINGIYRKPVGVAISIRCSVQPANENELKLLEEGRRVEGAYSLRSKQVIKEGDEFILFGDDHEVLRVQVWQNGVMPHYLGIAIRKHDVTHDDKDSR